MKNTLNSTNNSGFSNVLSHVRETFINEIVYLAAIQAMRTMLFDNQTFPTDFKHKKNLIEAIDSYLNLSGVALSKILDWSTIGAFITRHAEQMVAEAKAQKIAANSPQDTLAKNFADATEKVKATKESLSYLNSKIAILVQETNLEKISKGFITLMQQEKFYQVAMNLSNIARKFYRYTNIHPHQKEYFEKINSRPFQRLTRYHITVDPMLKALQKITANNYNTIIIKNFATSLDDIGDRLAQDASMQEYLRDLQSKILVPKNIQKIIQAHLNAGPKHKLPPDVMRAMHNLPYVVAKRYAKLTRLGWLGKKSLKAMQKGMEHIEKIKKFRNEELEQLKVLKRTASFKSLTSNSSAYTTISKTTPTALKSRNIFNILAREAKEKVAKRKLSVQENSDPNLAIIVYPGKDSFLQQSSHSYNFSRKIPNSVGLDVLRPLTFSAHEHYHSEVEKQAIQEKINGCIADLNLLRQRVILDKQLHNANLKQPNADFLKIKNALIKLEKKIRETKNILKNTDFADLNSTDVNRKKIDRAAVLENIAATIDALARERTLILQRGAKFKRPGSSH